ncbi:MAG: TolC family protein [Candidatus Omnitrophica bacterium]|nr:TolC family protein [Candidatus Omnitrophota bacterium]
MVPVRIFLMSILIVGSHSSLLFAQEELTWEDCLREAARNHPDLIAAEEGVVQGRAGKAIAASEALPQVTASAGASATSSDSGSSNSFDYGVSATQLLFDGFQTANNVRAASEDIQAARENFKFTSATVRFRLREAFINLLKAQDLVNLTEDIHNIRKRNLELISLRYESGTEHRGAYLTSYANVAQAEFEKNQAGRRVEVVQRQLLKELGRREFVPIVVKGDFEVSDKVLEKPDFEGLAKKNPSLLRIIAQKNAAAYDVKVNQGDAWPEISLTGGAAKSDSVWPPQDQETSGGVTVSLPLFEGGGRIARVIQAKSVYRQLEQQERSTKDSIVFTLGQEWNDLQDAWELVSVQKSFLDAAQERAKIAEQQYSIGIISFDDWTIIEDSLVTNKKSFLNAQANALLAEASWIQAKGETLEYEN